MSANTLIEWAHHTVNFWWGCVFARYRDGSVRDECMHCYAKRQAAFFAAGKATWAADGQRMIRHEKAAKELRKLDASARARGVRERVFINSMSDVFEPRADLNVARAALWEEAERATHLDILLLTKRPGIVLNLVPEAWRKQWPAHVWLGTTAGTQKAADENIPDLLAVPAKVRFLSCEPLLGEVNLVNAGGIWADMHGSISHEYQQPGRHVDWVICGGESGGGARPMHPDWARALRDQCTAAGVPFFFKQWGEWVDCDNCHAPDEAYAGKAEGWLAPDGKFRTGELGVDFFGGDFPIYRVGKKTAGRLLDGREWSQFPEVAP